MQPLQWEHRPDGLRAPALVCAFKGWNDAGDAASSAIQFVGSALGAERFATIDPEEFYDFQATRPRVKLVDGQAREVVWPAVELYAARVPRAPRDLILMSGSEPSFRWRTFCKIVVELAEALGTQLFVTLGALLADVPHTRPIAVTGLTSDPALVARLGLAPSSYEGPTGIVGDPARRLSAGRPAVGQPVGGRSPLHRGDPEPEGGAGAGAQARGSGRRGRGRLRAGIRRGRLRASGQRRRAERPRCPGVRRAPGADRQRGGRRRPGLAALRRDDRPRPAALPAPARSGRAARRAGPGRRCTRRSTRIIARPPGTRAGNRTSSRPQTTGSAQSPGPGSPPRPPWPHHTPNRRGRAPPMGTATF